MKVGLISCCSKKLDHESKAKDLYQSSLFKYGMKYLKEKECDVIYILSAKHGVLSLDEIVKPYNLTLNDQNIQYRKIWSENVLEDLNKKQDLNNDYFIILAGRNYREYILGKFSNYAIPMEGLTIGKQLKFLKEYFSR